MRPNLILIPLLLIAVGGVALWAQHSRQEAAGGNAAGPDQPPRRVPLLAEAVGYIGAILVLAGLSVAVSKRWEDIPTGARLAILGSTTLVLLGIGWLIRESLEPALARLAGVTWAVSVATFAGSAAVVNQFYDTSSETAFVTIATSSALYAAALWLIHRHAIQHAVTFGGVLVATASIITWLVNEPDGWMIAIPFWVIGIAWAAAGWRGWLTPHLVAVPLGLLVALIAPSGIELSGLRFGLGLTTAAAVMALSVAAGFTLGLGLASIAMLGYVVGSVTYYFGDTLGVPASLAVAGIVILGLAAAAARWHWFGSKHPPTSLPPAGDAPDTMPDRRRVA